MRQLLGLSKILFRPQHRLGRILPLLKTMGTIYRNLPVLWLGEAVDHRILWRAKKMGQNSIKNSETSVESGKML